jgi:hypothetical protein
MNKVSSSVWHKLAGTAVAWVKRKDANPNAPKISVSFTLNAAQLRSLGTIGSKGKDLKFSVALWDSQNTGNPNAPQFSGGLSVTVVNTPTVTDLELSELNEVTEVK